MVGVYEFIYFSELGKEGDVLGRATDGKYVIVKNKNKARIGELWLCRLSDKRATYYFGEPIYRLR